MTLVAPSCRGLTPLAISKKQRLKKIGKIARIHGFSLAASYAGFFS